MTDLLFMFAFWGFGVITGLGFGCAIGVHRYIHIQQKLEEA